MRKGIFVFVMLFVMGFAFTSVEVKANWETQVMISMVNTEGGLRFDDEVEFALYRDGQRVETRSTRTGSVAFFLDSTDIDLYEVHLVTADGLTSTSKVVPLNNFEVMDNENLHAGLVIRYNWPFSDVFVRIA